MCRPKSNNEKPDSLESILQELQFFFFDKLINVTQF